MHGALRSPYADDRAGRYDSLQNRAFARLANLIAEEVAEMAPVIHVGPVPDAERRVGIPGILWNTLPESGSIYIWNALATGLGIPRMRVSGGWTFGDTVVPELLASLARGGVVTQEHIDASWQNKLALNHYLDRMVVHVRDPRSSALEWAHHLLTLKARGGDVLWTTCERYCPDGYFSMTFPEQVEVQVQNFLPDAVRWIEGWLDAEEDRSFTTQILFTLYRDMVADEEAFLARVLSFYGIDTTWWTFVPFTPSAADDAMHEGEWHFRNRRVDEWRDSYTPEQIERAAKIMPERLLDRFGWDRE